MWQYLIFDLLLAVLVIGGIVVGLVSGSHRSKESILMTERHRILIVITILSISLVVGFGISLGAAQDNGSEIEWNHTYGGERDESASEVIETSDGGYLLVGESGFYDRDGVMDAWLVKTDASGTEQWNRSYGTANSVERAYSVIETADGGYLFAGTVRSNSTTLNQTDAWLVKVDSSGVEQWNRTFGGGGYDSAKSVIRADDGGYLFTGANDLTTGKVGAWLMKVNSSGAEQWNQTYDNISYDGNTILKTNDSGYLLAGAGPDSHSAPGDDAFLLKVDKSGQKEWNESYGGPLHDEASSVIETSDGNYLFTGIADQKDHSFGWLTKVNPTGNELWNRTYSNQDVSSGRSVVESDNGDYLFAGYTGPYTSGSQAWLVRTNRSGTKSRERVYGDSMASVGEGMYANSLIKIQDGYIFAGESYHNGSDEALLVKLQRDPNTANNSKITNSRNSSERTTTTELDEKPATTVITTSAQPTTAGSAADSPAEADRQTSQTDAIGPGFGIVAVALAIIGTAIISIRRSRGF